MLTPSEYRQLIVAEVGDTADGVVAANLPLLEERHAGVLDDDHRSLLVRRGAINILLAHYRDKIKVASRDTIVELQQQFDHLKDLLKNVNAEIGEIEAQAKKAAAEATAAQQANRRPAVGQLRAGVNVPGAPREWGGR